MPLARRKRVVLTQDDPSLENADPDTPVYHIPQTGEIFTDYSAYVSRMTFYRLKIFACETSGRQNLTYFEALESERAEARNLDARFPEPLKAAVLKSVQWQLVGRLDHLVEAVYERFKDRYFEGERVFVDFATSHADDDPKDVQGRGRYFVRIARVVPPPKARVPNGKRKASQMENGDVEEEQVAHDIYGDLKVAAAQVNALDDPKAYTYEAHIVEETPNGTHIPSQPTPQVGDFRNGATVMNIRCDVMSRDRLAFSKSILKRFIRECVDRDAAVASPWVVKKEIALKYHINQTMPDDIRKGVDTAKRTETEKRKRISEAKENPPPIKRPKRAKPPLTEEEKVVKAQNEEAVRIKREQDEARRQALTGCKKSVSRWPIEDLDVILTEKEKTAGKPLVRPVPHRITEFAAPESFEQFLMAWNFVTTYGHAFNFSPFTLDMLEAALHHNTAEPSLLIDTLHTGVISSCRSVSAGMAKTAGGVTSLLQEYEEEMEYEPEGGTDQVDIQTLVTSLSAFGSGWEKKAVNHETWPNALVSILKEHATVATMPTMRPVLAHLLFQPNDGMAIDDVKSDEPFVNAKPRERYYSLSFALKVSILAFLCNLSATSKAVHAALDQCEASLTEMRKEKVELKRQQKKLADQILAMSPEKRKISIKDFMTPKTNGKGKKKGSEQSVEGTPALESAAVSEPESADEVAAAVADLNVDSQSEVPSNEDVASVSASEPVSTPPVPGSTPGRTARTPRNSLRAKATDKARAIKKKEEPRPLTSQEEEELKTYQAEAAKVDKDLDQLELDFRQYLLLSRMRPLGEDRFHNKLWWFDGVGCMTLVDPNGNHLYGTGKIFLQGPSKEELEQIDVKAKVDPAIGLRREAEEGEGLLGVGEWAWYETPEELDAYMEWLNVKGAREHATEKALTRWKSFITGGMEARFKDIAYQSKPVEPRRGKKAAETPRPAYLNYVNLWDKK